MTDIRKRIGRSGTATYQVRYPDKGSRTGYSYKTFDTRKEAVAFREQPKSSSRSSRALRTVEQGLQKWLDVCEKEGRNGTDPVTAYTLKNYRYRRDCILAYGWTKPLHELAGPDIVEFRSWLLRTYSRPMAAKLLSSFHSMVLELIKRGVLTHDVVTGVSIRNGSRYDTPVVVPTVKDMGHLLDAADRLANAKNAQLQKAWERYRPMLYLAADTGMRPQEYIVVPNANLNDTGVTVDRALERGGGISVTKTPSGRRFIDLSTDTLAMVKHYGSQLAPQSAHDLVFPTASGHWQSPDNWRKRGFHIACETAGLIDVVEVDGELVERPRYTPYDLRHFFASMLIEKRTNLKRLQKLMGHADIETTLNVYGHLIEGAEAATEIQKGLLAQIRP